MTAPTRRAVLAALLAAGAVSVAGCSQRPADPLPQGWRRVDLGRLSFGLPPTWTNPSTQLRDPFTWGRNDGRGPLGSMRVMVAPQIDERDADLALARLIAVAQIGGPVGGLVGGLAGGSRDFVLTGQGPLTVPGATSGASARFRYTTDAARNPRAGLWVAAADRSSWHASVIAVTGDAVPFGIEQGLTASLRLNPTRDVGGPDGAHLPESTVGV